MPDDPPTPAEPDAHRERETRDEAHDEGGEPACWLERVCDRCGALIDATDHRCRAPAINPPARE